MTLCFGLICKHVTGGSANVGKASDKVTLAHSMCGQMTVEFCLVLSCVNVTCLMCSVVADSPWILAKHRRDRKIPFSAEDGYGTIKRRNDTSEPSPLFLPTNDAALVLPSVGDK